jgi:hypothetical protein
VERRSSPKDGRQWSETVREVLSRLDNAREVRGNIVGNGLARLADRLPRELPGPKVKPYRVPAPVRPVSTELTSVTLSSRESKPTQVPPSPKPASSDPATWRSYGDEFKQLADEETRIIRATKKERLLADCYFDSSATLEQTAKLELREGPDEYLKVRFEALATRAGIARGCANNGAPLKFWLFKLFLYLSETKSHHLFAPTGHVRIGDNPHSDLLKPHAGETVSRAGGIITNVHEASASFCFWLEKQALEAEHRHVGVDPNSQNVERKSTNAAASIIPTPSKKRDPEVAKRRALVKSNAGVSVHELCQIFERENVPLPANWQAAGLKTWVEAYKKYQRRIRVIVSKDRKSD